MSNEFIFIKKTAIKWFGKIGGGGISLKFWSKKELIVTDFLSIIIIYTTINSDVNLDFSLFWNKIYVYNPYWKIYFNLTLSIY